MCIYSSAARSAAFCALLCSALFVAPHLHAQERSFPDRSILVISTPGFPWAAEDVSKVLGVRATPLDVGLAEAAELVLGDPRLVGVVEVEINVAQFYETVYAICRDKQGREVWREKRMLNFGGGPERLARDMVGGLLKKVKGKKCPG